MLRYIYGFSISEISCMLEISEKALSKRFQNCKKKLRKAY
ncbi:sigma factor-like helix-turn-helix DNA-binding protein [Terrisporobacter vanillatitrophus]